MTKGKKRAGSPIESGAAAKSVTKGKKRAGSPVKSELFLNCEVVLQQNLGEYEYIGSSSPTPKPIPTAREFIFNLLG